MCGYMCLWEWVNLWMGVKMKVLVRRKERDWREGITLSIVKIPPTSLILKKTQFTGWIGNDL